MNRIHTCRGCVQDNDFWGADRGDSERQHALAAAAQLPGVRILHRSQIKPSQLVLDYSWYVLQATQRGVEPASPPHNPHNMCSGTYI